MGVRIEVARRRSEVAASDEGLRFTYEFSHQRIVIGRGPQAEVKLPHLSVSHSHVVLEPRGTDMTAEDQDSTNGTFVNGERIAARRAKTLRSGDKLEVGVFELTIVYGIAISEATTVEQTAMFARRIVRELLAGPARSSLTPRLSVTQGPDLGAQLEFLREGTFLLGRTDNCQLALYDEDVSREHAEVIFRGHVAEIRDLDSKNGVYVNGREVRAKTLRDGDEIDIGGNRLLYEDPAERSVHVVEVARDERLDGNEHESTSSRDGASRNGALFTESDAATPRRRGTTIGRTAGQPLAKSSESPGTPPSEEMLSGSKTVGSEKMHVESETAGARLGGSSKSKMERGELLVYGIATVVLIASVLGLAWLLVS